MPPPVYTVAEKIQFVKWYFLGNSSREIVNLFIAAYADRPAPNAGTVWATIKRFETLGCVVPCRECYQPSEQHKDESCAVRSCTSNALRDKKNSTGITFHSFPRDIKRRNIWINFVKRGEWVPTKTSKLCSKHFMEEHIDRTSLRCVRLKHKAIPTIGGPQDLQLTLPVKQEQDNSFDEEQNLEIEIQEHFLSNTIKEENDQISNKIKTELVSIKEEKDENLQADYSQN